jgi:hypothetical protein
MPSGVPFHHLPVFAILYPYQQHRQDAGSTKCSKRNSPEMIVSATETTQGAFTRPEVGTGTPETRLARESGQGVVWNSPTQSLASRHKGRDGPVTSLN